MLVFIATFRVLNITFQWKPIFFAINVSCLVKQTFNQTTIIFLKTYLLGIPRSLSRVKQYAWST